MWYCFADSELVLMKKLLGYLILGSLLLGFIWFMSLAVGLVVALKLIGGSLLFTALVYLGLWLIV